MEGCADRFYGCRHYLGSSATKFFQALFLGSGGDNAANPGFRLVLQQAVVAPLEAFFFGFTVWASIRTVVTTTITTMAARH